MRHLGLSIAFLHYFAFVSKITDMFLFDEREGDVWLDTCFWCNGEVMMTPQRERLLGKICDDCSVFAGLDSQAPDTDDEYDFE